MNRNKFNTSTYCRSVLTSPDPLCGEHQGTAAHSVVVLPDLSIQPCACSSTRLQNAPPFFLNPHWGSAHSTSCADPQAHEPPPLGHHSPQRQPPVPVPVLPTLCDPPEILCSEFDSHSSLSVSVSTPMGSLGHSYPVPRTYGCLSPTRPSLWLWRSGLPVQSACPQLPGQRQPQLLQPRSRGTDTNLEQSITDLTVLRPCISEIGWRNILEVYHVA